MAKPPNRHAQKRRRQRRRRRRRLQRLRAQRLRERRQRRKGVSEVFVDLPRMQPMNIPQLGVILKDWRDLDAEEWGEGLKEFFDGCEEDFLFRFSGPGMEMCRAGNCYDAFDLAYAELVTAARQQSLPFPTREEFSVTNAEGLIADFNQFPHLSMFFLTVHDATTDERVGVVYVSNVRQESRTASILAITGHGVMTLPDHATFSFEEQWVIVMRHLLNLNLQAVDPNDPDVDIVAWTLPSDSRGAYVDRPGNTFGGNLFRGASPGFNVTRHPDSNFPVEIRRGGR